MSTENPVRQWFAVYTRSNHEKSVAEQMEKRSIERFLPTYEVVRKWKDRRMRLSVPLFPGYVFVRFAFDHRIGVLAVPGVVRLVGFNGQPAALAESEIETLRLFDGKRICAEPHPYLTTGRKVRVIRGALIGLEGVLVRKKGIARLLLSIDLIRQSAIIEVDSADVEPISMPIRPAYSHLSSNGSSSRLDLIPGT